MHVNLKETTCSYRKGICTNPRAVKSKGTLHTLCQKQYVTYAIKRNESWFLKED